MITNIVSQSIYDDGIIMVSVNATRTIGDDKCVRSPTCSSNDIIIYIHNCVCVCVRTSHCVTPTAIIIIIIIITLVQVNYTAC